MRRLFLSTLAALSLLAAAPERGMAATVISNDGTGGLGGWGDWTNFAHAAIGQTFIAPTDQVLNSITFYVETWPDYPSEPFRAVVAPWDPSAQRPGASL
jgi:hypothetical protein